LNNPSESTIRDQVSAAVAQIISAAVAEVAEHRAAIEQAKGMFISLYGVDDKTAFDMLRRHSQNTNVRLRALAEQLMSDYRALSSKAALPARSMYSKTPTTVHERITPDPD
jgi:ANTAR domain-containing protein